jgi:hypothetical protein
MKTILLISIIAITVIGSSYSVVLTHNDCPASYTIENLANTAQCTADTDCSADQSCCLNKTGVKTCTAKCLERMIKCMADYTRAFKYNPLTGCNDAYCKAPVQPCNHQTYIMFVD